MADVDTLHVDHPVGSMTGSAVDRRTGRPMEFTAITVLGTGLGATARQGRFEILAVPVGHHRVQARFIQYWPQTLDVDVRENQVTQVTFRLELPPSHAPTIELNDSGVFRVDGVTVTQKNCPDSVVVTFELLHDEVRTDQDFECLIRIQNASTHRVRIPVDLTPLRLRFVHISERQPR